MDGCFYCVYVIHMLCNVHICLCLYRWRLKNWNGLLTLRYMILCYAMQQFKLLQLCIRYNVQNICTIYMLIKSKNRKKFFFLNLSRNSLHGTDPACEGKNIPAYRSPDLTLEREKRSLWTWNWICVWNRITQKQGSKKDVSKFLGSI